MESKVKVSAINNLAEPYETLGVSYSLKQFDDKFWVQVDTRTGHFLVPLEHVYLIEAETKEAE